MSPRRKRETFEQEALRLHAEHLASPTPETAKRLGVVLDALAAKAEIPTLEAAVKTAQDNLAAAHKRIDAAR